MRTAFVLASALIAFSCGNPGPLVVEPSAELPAPATKVEPPPGPFNDEVTLTFTSDRPATIYVSTDGRDPRTTSAGRLSGPSPLTVKLSATTTVKYFASERGKDEELKEAQWIRAGGPVGTISGVIVVGNFSVGQELGVLRNGRVTKLGKADMPGEIPFSFEGLETGSFRLQAISDRNDDQQLTPFIDFTSEVVTVELDLADPFKAGIEGVRLYLGASGSGLGTLEGTITLPEPPPLQNLQISVLNPSALTGGLDPQSLLTQLQSGYRIFTDPTQTKYPYVITNLEPGSVVPVPTLMGIGGGGLAINLMANPLRTVRIEADKVTRADFAFGPVDVAGQVTISAASAPTAGFGYGIIAARNTSFVDGIQAVLMPVILTRDTTANVSRASYAGSAIRGNTTLSLRVFTNANNANPITDALTWAINPLSGTPGHVTRQLGTTDQTIDIVVP